MRHANTKIRFIEFLVGGVLTHLMVTALFFRLATGRLPTIAEFGLAVLIIIPFSFVTEYVIDHPRFWHRLFRLPGHKFDDLEDLSK